MLELYEVTMYGHKNNKCLVLTLRHYGNQGFILYLYKTSTGLYSQEIQFSSHIILHTISIQININFQLRICFITWSVSKMSIE